MNFKKLLVLAGTVAMLAACGETKSTAPVTSKEAPIGESVHTPTPYSETPASSEATSTPAPVSTPAPTSSTPAPTSATPSSSTGTQTADRYAVNYRDTMAGADKNKVGDTVKAYTNEETFDGFVTSVVNTDKTSCQVASVDDVAGTFKVLQIGSSSSKGELTFTFSVNVKSVILSVENYNKNYVNGQTGEPGSSQDTTSKLYVNSDTNVIDLAATAGNPTKKDVSFDINSTTLKLYNKAEKNRVFVNAITFVLK